MKPYLSIILAVLLVITPLSYARAGNFTQIILGAVSVLAAVGTLGLSIPVQIAVSVANFALRVVVDSVSCDVNLIWGCKGNGGGGNGGGGGGGGGGGNSSGSGEGLSTKFMGSGAENYCYTSTPKQTLEWTSSSQSAYQVNVATDSGFSNIIDDSGKVISSSKSYKVTNGVLSYNAKYYWRVRIWDGNDKPTSYANGDFTTPIHQGPFVKFSWTPQKPVRGGTVTFTDSSTLFGGATASAFNWTFPPQTVLLTPPATDATEKVKFESLAPKENTVKLSVTDSDNLTCDASTDITLTKPIIDVKEVK